MRTSIARALILPVLLAIPFVSGCQSESKKHLYKAEDLFEKRDLDGAKKELELSIKADPNNLDAHKSLAHIDEALGAASMIGDDRLQKQSQGRVVPESFTHGSSAQRVRWFQRGFEGGEVRQCDTFAADRV